MGRIALALAAFLAVGHGAGAASIVNLDQDIQTITVTEGGERTEIQLATGQTEQFCMKGCFVTFPNGDREALTGGEMIEISGGVGHIR